jgi:hypothetical protein
MKPIRLASAACAVAALAVPAAASAHPSVYTSDARIGNPPVPQKRYVVANHGYTYVLTESNGKDNDFGVMDYKFMPGAYRGTLNLEQLLDEGDTGGQAHATCWDDGVADGDDVEDLWTTAAIADWQDTSAPIEPFYNYVPFQRAAVGIDDNPATWIGYVKNITGGAVDLATVSDDPATAATQLANLCTTIDGTFVPADTTQSSIAAFNSGTIEHTAAPLKAQITKLEGEKAAALHSAATADAAAKAATARALAAETALTAEKTAFSIKLSNTRQTARQVATRGAVVEITGPPSRHVTVRLLIASARAKALGLKTNVLGRGTLTTGADGTGRLTVEISKKAENALKNLKRALKLTISAVAGDRADSSRGMLTR